MLSSEPIRHTTRVHTHVDSNLEPVSSSFHLNQIKEFEKDAGDIHELDTPYYNEAPIKQFFDDDSIFLDELVKDGSVIHTTTLKHVDQPMFLEELFKDECDHNSEKTCVKELKSRVPFERRKLDLSIFTIDEPSNNQSFEN